MQSKQEGVQEVLNLFNSELKFRGSLINNPKGKEIKVFEEVIRSRCPSPSVS